MAGDEKKSSGSHKRKETPAESHDSDSEDSGMEDFVQVDFEFFDPKPIDHQGMKTLLRQSFSDTDDINLDELSDLIIAQPLVGSTVKADGQTDPFALLTVISLSHHKEKGCVVQLLNYLRQRLSKHQQKLSKLNEYLSDSSKHVGLVISERLINMPPQIAPPLYKMLLEEIQWACDDKEPFNFDYFMFISKTYREDESVADEVVDNEPQSRKKKKAKAMASTPVTLYFQAEDEIIFKYAEFSVDYRQIVTVDSATADSKRTFQDYGIETARKIMILKKDEMPKMLAELEELIK
ncbi:Mss4p nuclear export [Nowakowskiella sp. JEL0407]|nr:Mss4p nuclear export [Nowakowskiella sp. JEL0407]